MSFRTLSSYHFYTLVVLCNITLTALIFIHPEPINIDGILYLHTAQVYLQQGFHAAMSVYPWPFYSVLIAKTSRLIHANLLNSGLLCNTLFTSILTVYFIKIIPLMGGQRKHQYWAAAVILLYPFLNLDRFYILRDFGFYAFYMGSFFYFLKFLSDQKTLDGFLWQINLLIAALFRTEGIILLALIPSIYFIIACLNIRLTATIKNTLKLTGLSLALVFAGLLFFRQHLTFGRLSEIYSYINPHAFQSLFQEKCRIVQETVLGDLGKDNGAEFLIGGMISIFILTLTQTLGIFYTLLILAGVYQKTFQQKLTSIAKQGLSLYCVAVAIILFAFMAHLFFLSDRYIMPLALLLLLGLPFVFDFFWQNKKHLGKILICCILIYNTAASFGHFGHSKNYIVKTGQWIQQYQSQHKPPFFVYTSDSQLAFYANTVAQPLLQTVQKINAHPAIIAISLKSHENPMSDNNQFIAQLNKAPEKVFQNNAGDKIMIYILSSNMTFNKKRSVP